MGTTIITKNGSGAPAASDLVAGELAVDLTNKRLYTEDSSANILELGSNPSTIVVAGTSTLTGNVTASSDVSVGGNLTVTGNATIEGNLTFGNAATDTITLTADVASSIVPSADDTYDLGATASRWRDIYIDGTAYLDAINFNGTAITATAAELNILDGVTSTAAELNLVDGSSAGTIVNSKAVVYGASGEVNATTLQIAGTSITSTAAELNILDGVTATAAELNILDGVTSTAAELNLLDGVTATTAELNYLDVTTLGTVEASKAVTADANADVLFGDNDKAIFGAGPELQIYSDGTSGIIKDVGAGDIKILADDFYVQNAGGTSTLISVLDNGKVGLGFNGSEKLATTSTGIDVTGVITTDGMTTSGNVDFGDSDIARFGDGNDLQIYHDGANSYIEEAGTGNLFIRGTSLILEDAGGNDYIAMTDTGTGGTVEIKHNAATKLTTTSTGATISNTTSPVILLDTTTAATSTAEIQMEGYRTIADVGRLGQLSFLNARDGDTQAKIEVYANGDTEGFFKFYSATNNILDLRHNVTVFNEGGNDSDFRVESDNNANMIFVDAGSDHVSIGTSADYDAVLNVLSTDNGKTLSLVSTDTDANAGPILALTRQSSSSAADNDYIGEIKFEGLNDANEQIAYAGIAARIIDASDGTEDGRFEMYTELAGAQISRVLADSSTLIINQDSADLDFRVESDTNANALFVDAGASTVGINTSASNHGLTVTGGGTMTAGWNKSLMMTANFPVITWNSVAGSGGYSGIGYDASSSSHTINFWQAATSEDLPGTASRQSLVLRTGEVVVNETGADQDFRVESDNNFTALYVDANNDRIGIFEDAPAVPLHITTTAENSETVRIEGTNAGSGTGPILALDRNSASPADDDELARIYFYGRNNADERIEYGLVRSFINDVSDGSEDSTLQIFTYVGGAQSDRIKLAPSEMVLNEASRDTDFRLESDNNSRMLFVDGNNDRVGIGSTPNTTFHVVGPNQSGYGTMTLEGNADEVDPRLTFYGSSTTAGTTRAYTLDIFSDVSEKGARYDVPSSYYQSWTIAGTKKMTLDDSGNLLVGTTDSAPGVADTNVGVALNSGRVFASAEDDYALNLNRNTNDGDIVRFRKDGSTVGSIGTQGSSTYIAGASSGLRFAAANIMPANASGAFTDNTSDLGGSTERFKDLYLSGGVYVGGTGAANYLDDYEEGTFTPVLTFSSGSVAYGNQLGTYTKVGRKVTVQMSFGLSSVSSPSGALTITGLPFTNANGEGFVTSVNFGLIRSLSTAHDTVRGFINTNSSIITVTTNATNQGAVYLNADNLTATSLIYATCTYFAA